MSSPLASTVLRHAQNMQNERRNVRNLTKAIPELGAFRDFRKSWREASKSGCDMNQLRKAVEATMGATSGQSGIANFREMRPFMAPEMDPELADASGMRIAIKAMTDKFKDLQDAPMADGCETRPIEKSDVKAHTRVTRNGQVVQVQAYTDSRKAAMDATRHAHEASDKAMSSGEHEHHVEAAKAHMAAYRAHKEAHEQAPMEVKGDHEELMRHHGDASQYHMHSQEGPKAEEKEAPAADLVVKNENGSEREIPSAAVNHAIAARKTYDPLHKNARSAYDASVNAADASDRTIKNDTPEAHAEAAKLHGKAAMQHMGLHANEDSEDGPHGLAFQAHKEAMEQHEAKSGNAFRTVAKSGEDLGGDETMMEDETTERPMEKAHHEASTRTVNGKMVQVKAYDDARQAAHAASAAAHTATGSGNHAAAYEAHKTARMAHAEAADAAGREGKTAEAKFHKQGMDYHHEAVKFHDRGETKPEVPDDENPEYALQGQDSKHLGEAARGKRDLNMHAKRQLAQRGLDSNGKWIGFDKAEAHHGVKTDGGGDEVDGNFQTMHNKVLGAAARGEIDLNYLAKKELAARGQDSNGKWVGFDKAEAHHFPKGSEAKGKA